MHTSYMAPDASNMHGSIHQFLAQITYACADEQFHALVPPKASIVNVVIVGMGSSLIAFRLLESAYGHTFRLPVHVVNTATFPAWANKHTLVILSSYSGNTKETYACATAAHKQGCHMVGITSGGKLGALLPKQGHFVYRIPTHLYNPCGQPRMALGFSFGALIRVFEIYTLLQPQRAITNEIQKSIPAVRVATIEKRARTLSTALANTHVTIISGGYLSGNVELGVKHLHWNAKQYASGFCTPEAMHHICEGIHHPEEAITTFLLLQSPVLRSSDKKDLTIIQRYLRKNNKRLVICDIPASNPIDLVMRTVLLTAFIAFHLAMHYKLDPSPTPAIAFYKNHSSAI